MGNKREIMTYSGKMFDFFRPKPEMICIEDIAHALACTNRYSGHTREPYSVAEHSVRCSYLGIGDPLVNLMHDSAEAYIGDIAKPQKQGLNWYMPDYPGMMFEYKVVEAAILREIGKALKIPALESWITMPTETRVADLTMMITEIRDLMPPQAVKKFEELGWIPLGLEPAPYKIHPWRWEVAEIEFSERFMQLTEGLQ